MQKERAIKLFSILFLSVFFMKMVISLAPLVIVHFDKQAVHAVIMQLEIENNAKSNDVKETSVKEYFTLSSFGLVLLHPTELILISMINVDHDKHVQAFYPPVPTPPPNA
ncbi:MAG: hypothetical protein H7Y07_07305 [Pyrinomonadaceae bacterium]|nr:hypothetical protein [Sphingobacteriaceae bacterium]